MSPGDELQEVFYLQQARPLCKGSSGMGRKKWDQALPAEGASSKQVGPGKGQAKTLSAKLAGASHRVERVPYLNPDAFLGS